MNNSESSILRTPEEAYRCFQATEMDALVLEDFGGEWLPGARPKLKWPTPATVNRDLLPSNFLVWIWCGNEVPIREHLLLYREK